VVIVINSYDYDLLLGSDDSTLDKYYFRASWWLMVVSGVFCTLGR
jgi:hypothetical protein